MATYTPPHKRDLEDVEEKRSPKRSKLAILPTEEDHLHSSSSAAIVPASEKACGLLLGESLLPPSCALLGIPHVRRTEGGGASHIMETDVGISEYISRDMPAVGGIIKQRFTDFLVYEVDQDGNEIHIKSLSMPDSSKKPKANADTIVSAAHDPVAGSAPATDEIIDKTPIDPSTTSPHSEELVAVTFGPVVTGAPHSARETSTVSSSEETQTSEPWPDSFTIRLSAFLPEEKVMQVKQMYLEGPEPPFISDSGWGDRAVKSAGGLPEDVKPEPEPELKEEHTNKGKNSRGGHSSRGRGRGGRGGGRAGARVDHRKVISDPIASKSLRTEFHQAVRELFKGKLDSETDTSTPSDDGGSRIVVKWSHRGGRGARGGNHGGRGVRAEDKAARGTYPPYMHFTLQKTNRDTQDAISYLARTLHVNVKDLSVAGTKDKRGVTVQRVALRRGQKSVEDVWCLANGVPSRNSPEEAVRQRGSHGIRLSDFNYRKAPLELGMLKGNAFVITLRNVQVDSEEKLSEVMETMKRSGFINYYGMQRFGTASIPTHSIGLALLQSDWNRAVSLIMRERPGEHPDVVSARRAWLEEKNLDKALALMPRRVVAERCILESYKKQKGDTRNAYGALSTIPRNLRLMYVHAYQSYVWNAIVSERIKTYGHEKPIPGDLILVSKNANEVDVLDTGDVNADDDTESEKPQRKKSWHPPQVYTLTADDVDKYSIFDVVMPLPGKDVAFPGGELGGKYKEYLRRDGLDPDNFHRRQKDYSLSGSYRNILHLPRELSWEIFRYTDPDISLAQADEDKLLGYDASMSTPDGKFVALQIRLTLGTAAYATMALREITKAETSSHYQSSLTQASEDQQYRGVDGDGDETAVVAKDETDGNETVAMRD